MYVNLRSVVRKQYLSYLSRYQQASSTVPPTDFGLTILKHTVDDYRKLYELLQDMPVMLVVVTEEDNAISNNDLS